jgi:hypothetical protein
VRPPSKRKKEKKERREERREGGRNTGHGGVCLSSQRQEVLSRRVKVQASLSKSETPSPK